MLWFYINFLFSPLQCIVTHSRKCKRLREFEEIEISMQGCRGDSEQQGGKLWRILSGFRPRIRPQDWIRTRNLLGLFIYLVHRCHHPPWHPQPTWSLLYLCSTRIPKHRMPIHTVAHRYKMYFGRGKTKRPNLQRNRVGFQEKCFINGFYF